MIWRVRDCEISLERTLLMGVLNITPDSFSDGGKFFQSDKAIAQALRLVHEGADLLDLGAESSRPGATPVDVREEMQRLLPVLKYVRAAVHIPISIDTTKAEVAEACLEEGADIINDISGLRESGSAMAQIVRSYSAGLVLMHRRGNAQTMQSLANYEDVVKEVLQELRESVEIALRAGIDSAQLMIDPGLGFAKTPEQNLAILSQLEKFREMGLPVLIGPSRKSFIGKITGREPSEREYGTAAVAAYSVLKHVQVVRVHEVGWIKDVIRMIEAIQEAGHVRA